MKQINKPIRLIIPDVHGRTFWRSAIQNFGHTQQAFEPIITEHYANLDCRKSFLLMKDGNIEQVE